MDELFSLHCTKIQADTPSLAREEIERYQKQLPSWKVNFTPEEPRLEKEYKFKDFKEAMHFTDRLAQLADTEDHHPAILTEWGKVTVSWWTHRIKGLHKNDFIMAAKTDHLM
jgi:4a-hydroxytetrahydrobiopterin dehydratase